VRLAAIDIGSNSIRCTIVDVPVGGPRVVLDEEKTYARLGAGTAETGRLAEAAMETSVRALDTMLRIARGFEVTHVRAVATAAVRGAANGAAFVGRLRDELGLDVEVITGEHEGRLALLSAVESLALDGPIAVADIGGGSTEIVRATGRTVDSVLSLPLGAVVLSDAYRTGDPFPKGEYRRLGAHVRDTLAEGGAEALAPSAVLVGSGGTITTIAAIVAAQRDPGLASVHGYEVTRAEVSDVRERLARSSARERAALKGMSENRLDLIVAGAVVLDEVMKALGATSILVNARGMREGIIIEAVERERGVSSDVDTMRSVRAFGRKSRHDVPHSEQVCRLALSLFDQLGGQLDLDPADRPLLEAAALLHDVGYHISHEQHHKHSHHLIAHADLPGFSASERRLIAAIARYHAGSLPKAKHEAMQGLDDAGQELVARLAALLRLADGLDRPHAQRVEGVTAEVRSDRLLVRITGAGSLDVEAAAGIRKADLVERVWGLSVEIAHAEKRANAR